MEAIIAVMTNIKGAVACVHCNVPAVTMAYLDVAVAQNVKQKGGQNNGTAHDIPQKSA